ncbi:unnamed protein product [Symbiodinium sp. CCMP2592]|nr:unnamed protein product [Symbiodinium sp. CCMP2592]
MGKSAPSVVVAKKGKMRLVQKRPAIMKSSLWKNLAYTRDKNGVQPRGQRKDQIKWKRTLPELIKASDSHIIRILIADKLLPKSVAREPFRSSRWKDAACQLWMNPHHLHPLFTEGQGLQSQLLQSQAALLLLKLHRVPQSIIHMLLNVNHKAIEDVERKLCKLRQEHVESKEKAIQFGNGKSWVDVEADEATFDKRDISNCLEFKHLIQSPNATIMWEQWAGIVQRGRPETLILYKLQPKITVKRAPGPGAIRRIEWKGLAAKWLMNRKVVLHTDSAKSYKLKVFGVLHDRVVHCKNRVKIQGKWTWRAPHYVRIVKHTLPGGKGKTLNVKSGTQIIDRCWRFLKERVRVNQHTKCGSALLRAKLRSAQYEYWHRTDDLWVATGHLCQDSMKKFMS